MTAAFYDFISSIIIKHNIWFVQGDNNKDKNKYIEYGLDDFIVNSDNDKLSFNQNPILFLFCILDSIEPSKKLGIHSEGVAGSTSVKALLENFYFGVACENGKCEITIKIKDNIRLNACLHKYFNEIKSLEGWLNLRVEKEEERKEAIITFDVI